MFPIFIVHHDLQYWYCLMHMFQHHIYHRTTHFSPPIFQRSPYPLTKVIISADQLCYSDFDHLLFPYYVYLFPHMKMLIIYLSSAE